MVTIIWNFPTDGITAQFLRVPSSTMPNTILKYPSTAKKMYLTPLNIRQIEEKCV